MSSERGFVLPPGRGAFLRHAARGVPISGSSAAMCGRGAHTGAPAHGLTLGEVGGAGFNFASNSKMDGQDDEKKTVLPMSRHVPELVQVDELFGEDEKEAAKGVEKLADEDVIAKKIKESEVTEYKTAARGVSIGGRGAPVMRTAMVGALPPGAIPAMPPAGRGTGAPAPGPTLGEVAGACFNVAPNSKMGGKDDDKPPLSRHVPELVQVDELFGEDEKEAAKGVEKLADEDVTGKKIKGSEVSEYKTWEECGFPPQLLHNVKARSKYASPRNIQAFVMPMIDAGYDILGHSETGGGKTAAYVLPLIKQIMENPPKDKLTRCSPRAIVVAPTRELVLQLANQARKFADKTNVAVAKAYGQYSVHQNIVDIRDGCDILFATLGRLKHFVLEREIRFTNLRFFVLDEADHLLETSFWEDILTVMRCEGFPDLEHRQTLLFSATYSESVQKMADDFLKPNFVVVSLKETSRLACRKVKQEFITVGQSHKNEKIYEVLAKQLEDEKQRIEKIGRDVTTAHVSRTLVFVEHKRTSDVVAAYLSTKQILATSINGDRSQESREKALADFRRGFCHVLVATDVCARGLDIHDMEHVINYDLPQDVTTYIHRIGRTGRLFEGKSMSFVDPLVDGTELMKELVEVVRGVGQTPPQFLIDLSEGKKLEGFEEAPVAIPTVNQDVSLKPVILDNDDEW